MPFARGTKLLRAESFTSIHVLAAEALTCCLCDHEDVLASQFGAVADLVSLLLVSFSSTVIKCALALSSNFCGDDRSLSDHVNLVEIDSCLYPLTEWLTCGWSPPGLSHVLTAMLVPCLRVLAHSYHSLFYHGMANALWLLKAIMRQADALNPPVSVRSLSLACSPHFLAIIQNAFRSLSCFSTAQQSKRGQELSTEWQTGYKICRQLADICTSIANSASKVLPSDNTDEGMTYRLNAILMMLRSPILDVLINFTERGLPLSLHGTYAAIRLTRTTDALDEALRTVRFQFFPCLALRQEMDPSLDVDQVFVPSLCLSQSRRMCADVVRRLPLFADKDHFVPLLERLADSPWSIEEAMQYDFVAASQSMGYMENWEVLQAKMMHEAEAAVLTASVPSQASSWAVEVLWCCNPRCTNLSEPSELQLKTFACGGGCGFRYCSVQCQEQGWRAGHKDSCARCASVRMGSEI